MLLRDQSEPTKRAMLPGPLIPLPLQYEDSGHSSSARVTAGIDPIRAAPSVDDKAGSCALAVTRQWPKRFQANPILIVLSAFGTKARYGRWNRIFGSVRRGTGQNLTSSSLKYLSPIFRAGCA
jgi:hypothetical protein